MNEVLIIKFLLWLKVLNYFFLVSGLEIVITGSLILISGLGVSLLSFRFYLTGLKLSIVCAGGLIETSNS